MKIKTSGVGFLCACPAAIYEKLRKNCGKFIEALLTEHDLLSLKADLSKKNKKFYSAEYIEFSTFFTKDYTEFHMPDSKAFWSGTLVALIKGKYISRGRPLLEM